METRKCKSCGRELTPEHYKKTRWGTRAHVCNDCSNTKRQETRSKHIEMESQILEREIENARKLRITEFSPRELMEELSRRGYKGTLQYTYQKTEEIDICNF